MEKMLNTKTILKINEGYGIRVEELKEFQDSVFQDVYYDAFVLTKEIIKQNQKYMSDKNLEHDTERLYNIITFSGDRGSGKTSVLKSFTEALRQTKEDAYIDFVSQYEKRREKHILSDLKSREQVLERVSFEFLDCIDASLLESTEDIFDVILAKMLQKCLEHFNNVNYYQLGKQNIDKFTGYERNEILSEFDEISKNKQNLLLRKEGGKRSGETAVGLLRDLYGSLDLRESFRKLVPRYLQMISNISADRYDKNDKIDNMQFLVIRIDDLDMNMVNGYQFLEQIHRYLMVPGVIIYLAVSRKELEELCEDHFKGKYQDPRTLTRRYLEKVLPSSQRIYLPELINGRRGLCMEGDKLQLKETILWKIVRRTGVCYDGCGKKTHFYEIGNLRTLSNLWQLLDKMDIVVSFNKEYNDSAFIKNNLSALEKNIAMLRNDVVNRLAVEELNKSQMKIFENVCKADVSIQGSIFVGWAEKEMTFALEEYSYGDLLYIFYRLGKKKEEHKALVQCMLALESVDLVYQYYTLCYNNDKSERDKAQIRLRNFLGDSVCGDWGNSLFYINMDNYPVKIGFLRHWNIENKNENDKVSYNLQGNYDKNNKEKIFEWIINLFENEEYNLVVVLEILFQFLIGNKMTTTDNERGIIIEEKEDMAPNGTPLPDDSWNTESVQYQLVIQGQDYNFDIFGFGLHALFYENYFETIENMLIAMIKQVCSKHKIELNEQEENIRELIKKKSLKNKYEEWKDQWGMQALPVCNIDVMYNIIKRTVRDAGQTLSYPVPPDMIIKRLKEVYEIVAKKLDDEESFYIKEINEQKENKCNVHWKEAFEKCPFIEYINKTSENSIIFKSLFTDIVKKIAENNISKNMKQPLSYEE